MSAHRLRLLALGLVFAAALTPAASARPRPLPNRAEVQLQLERLGVLGSVLYIAAHPDDENTAFLAWAANSGLRTGYLSLTRGDGGQNLIGSERGAGLGVIRTHELLAARGIDGAEQMFTRAIDFGFSKSPEETLAIWDREAVLGDVVWAIRRFRPDVIVTRFSPTYRQTHGHHVASAILAIDAFHAAGDPSRFKQQLADVTPWQPRRLFWNNWRARTEDRAPEAPTLVTVDLGAYNPILGESYGEIAARSRSQHRSQGFGAAGRRGRRLDHLELLAGDGLAIGTDPFEGIDRTWRRLAGGDAIADLVGAARAQLGQGPLLPSLLAIEDALDELPPDPWIELKRRELRALIRADAGLWIEAIADRHTVPRGGELEVAVSVLSRSVRAWSVESVEVSHARQPPSIGRDRLPFNEAWSRSFEVTVPADAPLTQPYWLEEPAEGGVFRVAERALIGRPESPPGLTARVTLRAPGDPGRTYTFEEAVCHRWTDPVRGELYREVAIVPPVSLSLDAEVYLFTAPEPRPVAVRVRASSGGHEGVVRLRVPPGFEAAPAEIPFELPEAGVEIVARFEVTPTGDAAAGEILAEAVIGEAIHRRRLVRVEHDHIPIQTLQPPATARAVRVDLGVERVRVGYVAGSGDAVPAALRQAGYDVTLLEDADLEAGELDRFDAIVLGIRAFNTRPRLALQKHRLFEWVEAGGTLVAQYNVSMRLETEIGPYPLTLSRDRITDETATLRFLDPGHQVLTAPNRLGPSDFEGWVQERGLYFASEWDDEYEALLAGHDPGETETRGALLVAEHGEGVYIYTGLSFFRQLPAGVPGAFRLFANLLAAGE